MPAKIQVSPLALLPVEIQRNIATSLDYMSLCQFRSTSRHFYNLLTESEVHAVFMNIDLPQGDSSKAIKDGGMCLTCCNYCDATDHQMNLGAQRDKEIQEEIHEAETARWKARRDLSGARQAATRARATVNRTEKTGGKELTKKKKAAKKADAVASDAHQEYLRASDRVTTARTRIWADERPQACGQICRSCKRKRNGYPNPGVLDRADLSPYYSYPSRFCYRMSHYDNNQSLQVNLDAIQKDGKICNSCYQGGRRGATGKARRKAFMEEFGYWMRVNWLDVGMTLKMQAETLALKSFGEIEEEQEDQPWGITVELKET